MALYPRQLHPWDLTPAQALALQAELRALLYHIPMATPPRLIAGVAASCTSGWVHAAAAVYAYPTLTLIEIATAEGASTLPYQPGLLAFCVGPVVLEALARLNSEPEVVMVQGHGIAHPRRMGWAAHLGLLLERPTLGCADALLCGSHAPLPATRGSWAPVTDGAEVMGAALRTQEGVRPLYVSPGQGLDVASALSLALACAPRFRWPEPLRTARRCSKQERAKHQRHDQA